MYKALTKVTLTLGLWLAGCGVLAAESEGILFLRLERDAAAVRLIEIEYRPGSVKNSAVNENWRGGIRFEARDAVGQVLYKNLRFVSTLLKDDPWLRKW